MVGRGATTPTAVEAKAGDSGDQEQDQIIEQDKHVIGFGLRMKGKTYADGYADKKFRSWYLNRAKGGMGNFGDAQGLWGRSCVEGNGCNWSRCAISRRYTVFR